MLQKKTSNIIYAALTAALYVVLTLISASLGLSSGVIQFRLSEALCILPCFIPSSVPGLFVGCLLANIITGSLPWDIVFGSLATLVGAVCAYLLRKHPYLTPWPNVIANTIAIPLILRFVYGTEGALYFFIVTVGIGEIVTSGILGTIIVIILKKRNFSIENLKPLKKGK